MSRLARNLPWQQASTQWPSTLDPIIANPLLGGQQIDSIILLSGVQNMINHSLGQAPQGWFPVDKNAAANVFRTQPFNSKTITLEADANVTISIWIY